ncbi:MAG TPA: type II toxin-antitoxin system HicB family antitoxin [Oscillatoriaceae cyanobacterium]
MTAYLGFVEHEPGRSYGVFFPDFPGLASGGETLEEALIKAPQGLRFHVASMLADGDQVPAPTPFDDLIADPQYQGLTPFVTEVSTEKPEVTRINLSMDKRLLREIDAHADRIGMTRSAFLADAAKRAMLV